MVNSLRKPNILVESFLISREQREEMNRQKSFVVWLTGLSGAGKSTIARYLELVLFQSGIRTLILDGDNTRQSINRDLDFSPEGRKENIRRVAGIARLLNDAGVVAITAFISPFTTDREIARSIIGNDCFVEVFVDTPLRICMERDTKGLYQKALNGELNDFTGISSPYEPPVKPSLTVHTKDQLPKDTVLEIVSWLVHNHYIRSVVQNSY
nr:adenylyl-sulfate kinase [uncultured Draconibacterium sp.]